MDVWRCAGRVLAASRSPVDGSLGIRVSGNTTSGFYIAEEGATKFKSVALPHAATIGWGGGLNLLSKDRAYVGLVEGRRPSLRCSLDASMAMTS